MIGRHWHVIGGIDAEVPVTHHARTSRDEFADDDVLLEAIERVAAAIDGSLGEYASGLLE